MFRVEMLPAAEGDCLWIEYGDPARPHRIVVDTGTPGTYKVLAKRIHDLPAGRRNIDLFIVTHLDSDHIGAAPHLLNKRPLGIEFGDVWFNGFRHLLQAADRLGERHAQELSMALERQQVPWNEAFGGGPVMVPGSGEPPSRLLAGDMKLTILSPYREQLEALIPRWEDYLRDVSEKRPELVDKVAADHLGARVNVEALAQLPFEEDTKPPNGSSIAILADFEQYRVLLGADAFPSVIERSIDTLLTKKDASRMALDAFKICHHGSARNTSPTLAQKLSARSLLVSSNGTRHEHPDRESIARLLYHSDAADMRMLFNYRTSFNDVWDDAILKRKHRFRTEYPEAGRTGIVWSATD